MQIIVAHPSWPWQDMAISLAMHKPNIWIDLSGWSPKYLPPQLVQYANTLLKDGSSSAAADRRSDYSSRRRSRGDGTRRPRRGGAIVRA